MFSGIKSIIFGYSEPQQTNSDNNESNIDEKSSFNDTSALLEQTLNTATTKFTEQLLPQSPSIEQLQSSSHQLLPTLNEQHEEDELKKKKQLQLDASDEGDEEDECFIADSWELLDLVEKPEVGSLHSSVQNENSTIKVGGILKQAASNCSNGGNSSSSSTRTTSSDQKNGHQAAGQRQKPKVTFETPDLVREKQNIEGTTPKDNSNSKLSPRSRKGKKKNKHTIASVSAIANLGSKPETVKPPEAIPSSSSLAGLVVGAVSEKEEGIKLKAQKEAPILNYAAVLSMKLRENADGIERPLRASSVQKGVAVNFQASGAIKRNRPVSSSSWSSSDEIEAINSIWNDEGEVFENEAGQQAANDDNDSIISSGFSDCDYGYEGLNDFVMRPKKGQNKKRSGLCTSSSLLNLAKRGGDQAASGSSNKRTGNESRHDSKGSSEFKGKQTTSSKHIKPKKKKLVLSPSSSDFLKRRSDQKPMASEEWPIASTSSFLGNVSNTEPKSKANVRSQATSVEVSEIASHLMPPPATATQASLGGSSSSGNDSSDIAEMDESWYVTPPPCFTGSNKFGNNNRTNPKAKEAARENALIEHPSIYIASTSREQPQNVCNKVNSNNSSKNSFVENQSKQKTNVLKKASKQIAGPSAAPMESIVERKRKVAPIEVQRAKFVESKTGKGAKAWENKFIVTNWNLDDDQDDINDDFDNLFEVGEQHQGPVKNSSSSKKSKAMAKKQQKSRSRQASLRNESPTLLELSAGYESDFSIPSPALIGITDDSSELPIEMEQSDRQADLNLIVSATDENFKPSLSSKGSLKQRRRNKLADERKAPIQVRPIEPERQPGWQLRRRRSRRRPLSVSTNTCNAAGGKHNQAPAMKKTTQPSEQQLLSGETGSNGSSARSSPTFIDRIGSSIVANLTNLTNLTSGFPVAATLPMQPRASMDEVEKMSQAVARKSSISNLVARRRMSKAYLDRQNDCAKSANSNRRADRRLKMYTTLNGSSVNRKVQTSFH